MKALSFLRRTPGQLAGALSLALAITSAATAQVPEQAPDPNVDPIAASDRLSEAFDALEAAGFTGIVGLSLEGETVLMRGAGEADPQTGRLFGPDTQVDIASITKSYTGMLAAQLISDGTLSADLRLADVFDDVPADKADITLHQLLTHAAGLPGGVGDDLVDEDFDTFRANAFAAPLRFEPGTAYYYSNVGFSLAAAMIEQATGQTYETLLRDRLAAAGIHDTGYQAAHDTQRSVHLRDGRDVSEASWGGHPPNWNLIGNGGLVSTAPDMLAWRQAWSAGELISPEARDHGQTPFQDEGGGASYYGYGLVVEDDPELGRIYWHNGGSAHFNAHWRELADHGVILFVATNQRHLNADRVVDVLTAAWFDRPWQVVPATPPADASAKLPDTPAARLVRDYLAALDAEAAARQAFIEARFTPALLAAAPLQEHLALFEQVAADLTDHRLAAFQSGEAQVRIAVYAPALGRTIELVFETPNPQTRQIAGLQVG